MKKKIIIIGAGISGLAAGCYGQINGYETEIFEMHNIPGGLCTAWTRKGYTIDGCIHWLMGATPDSMFYSSWKEIGALEGKEFVYHDYIMQIEGDSGEKLVLYTDIDRLERHMLELSPQDSAIISGLAEAVRRFKDIRSAAMNPELAKYFRISIFEFVQQFQNPFIKEALFSFAPKEYMVFSLIFQLAVYNNKDACWPIGGSLEFAKSIEKSYLDLGGKIRYKAKVDEIMVKEGRTKGIMLADGSEYFADFVISAADGYATIFNMLKGKYMDNEIQALYNNSRVSRTSIQVSLGIDCDLSDQPYSLNIKLDSPVNIGGVENTHFLVRNYCYDRTMCLPGKTVVTSLIYTNYEYWENLYNDKEAYDTEKKRIEEKFIEVFEKRFPESKDKIEVVDVATPVTYNRYTGVWKGAYCGWQSPVNKVPSVLPGLEGFYLAGQWATTLGGLPSALMTAKRSVMALCKDDEKEFVSNVVR